MIEVKHWDRAFLKNQPVVQKEATKLNDKVRRLVGMPRRAGIDPGFVTGRFLLTRDGVRWDNQRPEFHGCNFFGLSEWKQLLDVESGTTFDEASILRASEIIQPLSKVALTGEIRRIAGVRNLELQSPRGERFHCVYRGEHIRTRNKVILHLYDLSDNQPVFTAFDLSRISGTLTVSPGAIVREATAWVAPEVKAQGFPLSHEPE